MASINYVVQKLAAAGLQVEVDGEFVLVEDPDCGFERSHDGAKGISKWFRETLDEYEAALEEAIRSSEIEADLEEALANEEPWELSPEYQAAGLPQEEPMFNFVEVFLSSVLGLRAQEPTEEFTPAPPVKEHAPVSDQLAIAREFNGVKEIAQALENDLQDRGGIPDPVGFITQRKQEAAMSVVHTEKVEFVVSGVGYRTGKFSRGFDEVVEAKSFARKCSAAAQNASYAATIKITPFTTRRAV